MRYEKALRQGKPLPQEELLEESILSRIEVKIASESEPKLKQVINATGTVLHTNLGRAVLPQAAMDALSTIGRHPVNLEYDLVRGKRGKREEPVENALLELTGAQAATVVNNNAAAVLLGLEYPRIWHGSDRVPRRTNRDRRLFPDSRDHGKKRGYSQGGGEHQSHPPQGL